MTITKVIHERGLTAHSLAESKQLHASYGLRPILATDARPSGDLDLLLAVDGALLGPQVSRIVSTSITGVALLLKKRALIYDLGAVAHHCSNLAREYSIVVGEFNRIRSIPGYKEPESDVVQFARQAESYYEFDALLSAGRRVYDKIASYVWQVFEGGGNMPRGMAGLLGGRLQRYPPQLAERLQKSWTDIGKQLKDHRDCTQHFASADFGIAMVTMQRLPGGVWSASARIPDNPETKSKDKFSYASGYDALTYAWGVTIEVISLAVEAVTAASASDTAETKQ